MRASVLQATRENPEERKKDYNSMTDKKDLREVKYISLLVEENSYSASPFRCAWVEIFERAQRPQPDRRLALTSLLVSQTNHNLFNWWKYRQRRRFVNVFNLRTKNKISVLSENRGSHNVKRGTGKARAVEMKHSCHLNTAEPEHIVRYTFFTKGEVGTFGDEHQRWEGYVPTLPLPQAWSIKNCFFFQ